MICPVCESDEIEKVRFFNGKFGRHKMQTAVGFFCTICNHSVVELIASKSAKEIINTTETARFDFWKFG